MNLQPVYGERCLHIPQEKAIVVADLHIGIEYEFEKKGIKIPMQTKKMLERIVKIVRRKKAEKIILLGDIKHVIADKENMMKERREVGYFLKELSNHADIWIVRGNHDGRLRSKYAKIYGARGVYVNGIAMAHGHAWPARDIMDSEIFIMAHLHPHIRIATMAGYSYMEPCWVRGRMGEKFMERYPEGNSRMEVIVMPAFNPLAGGIAVNKERISHGIAGVIDWKNSCIYLLNGMNLGRIRNLS